MDEILKKLEEEDRERPPVFIPEPNVYVGTVHEDPEGNIHLGKGRKINDENGNFLALSGRFTEKGCNAKSDHYWDFDGNDMYVINGNHIAFRKVMSANFAGTYFSVFDGKRCLNCDSGIQTVSDYARDHTGGLLKLLTRVNSNPLIIAHPEVFSPKYAILPSLGLNELTYTGPSYSLGELKRHAEVILSRDPVPIAKDIMTTGEIPRKNDFEIVRGFYKVEDGKSMTDDLQDDQALVVRMRDGLVILLGLWQQQGG